VLFVLVDVELPVDVLLPVDEIIDGVRGAGGSGPESRLIGAARGAALGSGSMLTAGVPRPADVDVLEPVELPSRLESRTLVLRDVPRAAGFA